MKRGSVLYNFTLALWVGGISLFTFLVTPIIFQSFGRDTAGEIVGKIFPYYFPYNLFLSVAALAIFLLFFGILLTIAVLINLFVTFKLHPDITRIKQQIKTFETRSDESPLRNQFRKLHTISAILNILLLIDGATLIILNNISNKQEIQH